MSYIIRPKGLPRYFYCSPYIGFTTIEQSALRYVSREVAQLAAELLYADLKAVFPNHMGLVVEKLR